MGATAAVWAIAALGDFDTRKVPSPSVADTPPWQQQYTSPSPQYTPPSTSYTPPVPAPAVETKPPVGDGLLLSIEQIRYCLAQKIRLEGAQTLVNSYNHAQVDRFNRMVDDYNSRCAHYRYRTGTLDTARAQVNAYEAQFRAQGEALFQR